jgi:ABC-2 type transport system ATP-binding protein
MIRAQALRKQFGDVVAVDGVDLHVSAGEILALLGPNGAGKTTTVRILAAILKPSAGRAQVAGYDTVHDARAVRRSVGVLTEAPGLYRRMKAREYLEFYGQLYGMDRADSIRTGERLMAQLEMDDAWDLRLGEYSKGMRQKLALIRTMLHNPTVLLLDEPTSAMDPHSAKLVRDSILSLQRDDRAIVICTHNLAEAELLADRIAIIRRGAIVTRGTVDQLKQELLGAPIYELRVAGAIDGLADALEDLVALDGHGTNWLRYRTDRAPELNPAILARAAQSGHAVITLEQVPRSLEEVYLQVVADRSTTGKAGLP